MRACDMCGKRIEGSQMILAMYNAELERYCEDPRDDVDVDHFDLCEDCAKKIKKIIYNYKEDEA